MRARATKLLLTAVLVSLNSGCLTFVTVEPVLDAVPAPRAAQRPALDFGLHATLDPRLVAPELDGKAARELDGEDLAEATATFQGLLCATGAFASVERAPAGRRLHCELQARSAGMLHGGGVLFALTCGLVPELQTGADELVAQVTAPGRAPKSYRVTCHNSTWLWLPLLPVGLVQGLVQRFPPQQAVDALVAQMARDGWLE